MASTVESGGLEEQVRKLAELQVSTRKIAELTNRSQSTVVRILKRSDTGPQPSMRERRWRWRRPTGEEMRAVTLALIAVALLVLAAAVASIAWK